ncbi:class I SAM-dependent methyltransferase [Lederbergia galactosidilytica]|uniref:SAM-dependent methyltransferase n=1 Tax=Lederbergia galactosidilytica TaxID=217031 RepID=A0A177ZLI7_9BACI|nr:class I SAM-dependent methyltransferase [Lederbergia galactosidilytica]KRG12616.1 SAM-dependent methyltransferase [Virgibacillus soli]MBP1916102.1 ubiquinone/menaquinone biosynthesis C-methylase UbiE [Lederbergia galactosidilytica]OAK68443.1 SAM-dependent methyltransferase [Lederbergia galactosidilytica]
MQDIRANNVDRFLGYSQFYDQNRPVPPADVVRILTRYLTDAPNRVVDVGCGTGLSSFIWLDQAKDIIGVEPNDDMRETAISHWQSQQRPKNLRFVKGISDQLELDSNSVDILTCSQSFHWMDPQPTLREFARVLRDGGVFAAYDCDWPPTFTKEVEEHYHTLIALAEARVIELAPAEQLAFKWDKNKHLQQIRESQLFSFSKEIVFHQWERCEANRYANIALSQGGLQTALKLGADDLHKEIQAFQDHVQEAFASQTQDILFSYRMRLGIK